ncbi:MAG: glycoside hydrolase family protein [Chloroflexi bacterium]|nr:glycoside hydrolase family protein [Chloroflexota bacterium]
MERQPPAVYHFLYFVAAIATILLFSLLAAAAVDPPEWTPTFDPIDNTLLPAREPQPPPRLPDAWTERQNSPPSPTPQPYTLRWRAGVSLPDQDPTWLAWPRQRPGWYLNWETNQQSEPILWGLGQRPQIALPPATLGIEFVPVVRMQNGHLHPAPSILSELAQHHRGATWLIGNEPDVRWQDNTSPEVYAVAYHRAYHAIKSADPTAQVAAGGLIQITPLRLRYLERVWQFYRSLYQTAMPVDVWTMHAYVLHEARNGWGANIPPGFAIEQQGVAWGVQDHDSLALVEQQVRAMRRWMSAHGQQHKPLWVTGYGILLPAEYGFDTERVATFLRGSFALFTALTDPALGPAYDAHRLVQRWSWSFARDNRYPTGNLFDDQGDPTPLGDLYSALLSP